MLRLTICLVILLFDGASYAKENQPRKSRKAGDPERQQIFPNFPAFGGAVGSFIVFVESPSIREGEKDNSTWNSKECPEAKSHDDADLCEQRRMSKAADDSVSLNKVQVLLGIAGFLALLVTIWLTYRATSAAIESNKISSDTAKRELRAYVFAAQAKIEFTENTAKVTVAIFNYGQTPAYKFDHTTRIDVNVLPFEPDYIVEGQRDQKRLDSIPPRGNSGVIVESAPLVGNRIALAKAGIMPTFVSGTIWYEDAFGEERYTKFRFVYRGIETSPPGIMMSAEAGNEAT